MAAPRRACLRLATASGVWGVLLKSPQAARHHPVDGWWCVMIRSTMSLDKSRECQSISIPWGCTITDLHTGRSHFARWPPAAHTHASGSTAQAARSGRLLIRIRCWMMMDRPSCEIDIIDRIDPNTHPQTPDLSGQRLAWFCFVIGRRWNARIQTTYRSQDSHRIAHHVAHTPTRRRREA